MKEQFPIRVDLRTEHDRIEYQGQEADGQNDHPIGWYNSCRAFGVTSALETVFARADMPVQLSAAYLWWFTKQSGYTIEDAFAALKKWGVCTDATCPYQLLHVKPSEKAIAEAMELFPVGSCEEQEVWGIDGIRRSLALGSTVVAKVNMTASFQMLGAPQRWQTMEWDYRTAILDEHIVAIVGYDDVLQRFIAVNSWSKAWGDSGVFGVPYSYLGGFLTRMWRFNKLPVPFIPHPDYKEGSYATFELGVIRIPELLTMWPMTGRPAVLESDVVFHFGDAIDFVVVWDDPECQQDATYVATTDVLHLPKIDVTIDGITQTLEKVILTGAKLERQ